MKKNKKRLNIKMIILPILILLIIVCIITTLTLKNNKNYQTSKDYKEVTIRNKKYYQRLTNNAWKGEYHQDNFDTENAVDSIIKVVSYSEYLETINSINSVISDKIKPYYTNENSNYIILSYSNGHSWCRMELINCIEKDNKIIIYGAEKTNGVMASGSGYFIAIPTNLSVDTKIDFRNCYTKSEINNLKKYNSTYNPTNIVSDKPIIYLYPTKETEISVKLLKKENITYSYPKYKDKWKVLAQPNGNLQDLSTGRNLYALYYENNNTKNFKVEKDGFIVKGKDTIKFLEEKLAVLGLSEREAEEFIIYWLPKLESNKYNYIRFATQDEINENMPIEINPNSDTIIRVLMTFKKLDNPINIQEQQLKTPNRTGYTVVEWGGTEIK